MPKQYRVDIMNDAEILDWTTDQPYQWQDEVWKLSGSVDLQTYINFIKLNYKQLKQLENEKARTDREA